MVAVCAASIYSSMSLAGNVARLLALTLGSAEDTCKENGKANLEITVHRMSAKQSRLHLSISFFSSTKKHWQNNFISVSIWKFFGAQGKFLLISAHPILRFLLSRLGIDPLPIKNSIIFAAAPVFPIKLSVAPCFLRNKDLRGLCGILVLIGEYKSALDIRSRTWHNTQSFFVVKFSVFNDAI